jgi:hypothetical protein
MKRRQVIASVAAILAFAPLSAAVAQAGAPDQATVRQLIMAVFHPGGANPQTKTDIHSVVIEPGHKASAHEGMQYQVSLGQMIYPVHAAWTNTTGNGPSAFVRDYDTHYFVFRSVQKNGAWDLTSDSKPGDKNGVLRGS